METFFRETETVSFMNDFTVLSEHNSETILAY